MRARIVFVLLFASACAPTLRSVPMNNPAAGLAPAQELRIPNDDRRLRRDCEARAAHDCLDVFWRLESVEPDRVVFRYRVISPTVEGARARPSYIDRIELVTEDGRRVPAQLAEEFRVGALPPLEYSDDGYVRTGRVVHRRQADGSVVSEPETRRGTVTRTLRRFCGTNFVVFEGSNLVTSQSGWVKFRFPSGLLVDGHPEWTFRFDGSPPSNALVATDREPTRPL